MGNSKPGNILILRGNHYFLLNSDLMAERKIKLTSATFKSQPKVGKKGIIFNVAKISWRYRQAAIYSFKKID